MGMGIERVIRELLGKHALTYVEISREIHSSAEDVSAWSRGVRKPRRSPERKLRSLLHRENERERSRVRYGGGGVSDTGMDIELVRLASIAELSRCLPVKRA